MHVRIHQLTKAFDTTPVLRQVTLEVRDREFFFLLGPSGCGKTTLLRTLAGFYQPDAGEVWFGDRLMNGVEPQHRNTGMVFQNYALWPHLSVTQNVAYGLEVRAIPASERQDRVRDALRIVRMEDFADRSPNQLSGGQQQRVALARALVIRPDVLLLDEPLSNLDARLRLEMRDEIRRIHEETRLTTVYVTHDQKEALSMADRVAVLRAGVVDQIGTPRELYRSPVNRFVADFIGEMNWLPAIVGATPPTPDTLALETPLGPWTAHAPQTTSGPASPPTGTRLDIGFRPESIRLLNPATDGLPGNRFQAVIEQVTYLGETELCQVRHSSGTTLKVLECPPRSTRTPGTRVDCRVDPGDLVVLTPEADLTTAAPPRATIAPSG